MQVADTGSAGGGRDGVGREQGDQGQLLRLGEGWFRFGGRHGEIAGRLKLAGFGRICQDLARFLG